MAAFNVPEQTSALYTATLVDETGAVVPGTSLLTLTLTLYDKTTGGILNSRNAQNVLNANGVTIDANGLVSWTIAPADSLIITNTNDVETHIALFQATWGGGAKALKFEVTLLVKNLGMVT